MGEVRADASVLDEEQDGGGMVGSDPEREAYSRSCGGSWARARGSGRDGRWRWSRMLCQEDAEASCRTEDERGPFRVDL